MTTIPLLSVFFGGLLVIFFTGRLIGHIIGLDKYFYNDKNPATSAPYKTRGKNRRKERAKKGSPGSDTESSGKNMIYPGQEYAGRNQNF